jgi:hypothetical protein
MGVPIQSGDLVAQHPKDTIVYALPPEVTGDLKLSKVRPASDQVELRAVLDGNALTVSGGVGGARYAIEMGPFRFEIRVTAKGLFIPVLDATGMQVFEEHPRADGGTVKIPKLDLAKNSQGSVTVRRAGADAVHEDVARFSPRRLGA